MNSFIVGLAIYAFQGLNREQCRDALRAWDGVKNPAVSVLWGTFGDSTSCLHDFTKLPGNKTIYIHATNQTCFRNGRVCVGGEVGEGLRTAGEYNAALENKNPTYLNRLKKRAREITRFIQAHPGTNFIVSTGLEDEYSHRAYRTVSQALESTQRAGAMLVRNPMRHGSNHSSNCSVSPIELHSLYPTGDTCIWSNDGFDIRFPEQQPDSNKIELSRLHSVISREKGSGYYFPWYGEIQGCRAGAKFVEPRKRRLVVNISHIKALNRFIRRTEP